MTIEDLPFLLETRNDDTTRINLENDSVFTLNECENWFRNLKYPWYTILNQKGIRVGYFRTGPGNEIGCDIHPSHRKKGYARAAYIEYLKNVDIASLWVFKDNFAINLYKSLGFKENGMSKLVRGRIYVYMTLEKTYENC